MRKKLLFITPNHYSFYEVIKDGFIKYSDYEVITVISDEKYVYKDIFERVKNFFFKFFFGKKIKIRNAKKKIFNQINKLSEFEISFVIRPDILEKELLLLLKTKSKIRIVNYWDSMDKIKGQSETIAYFDICFSFDPDDCLHFGLKQSFNFYFNTKKKINPKYDVFFTGTFDNRFKNLLSIITLLNKNNIRTNAILYTKYKNIAANNSNQYINFIHKIIPFSEVALYNQNTKIMLDVKHDNQVGLSFRPFEAIGMKKKLITNNENIKEYDFYNPNNIFIWTIETISIPESFLITPYEDLPINIFEKYSQKYWVKHVLSINS